MRVIKDNPGFDKPREKVESYFSRGDLFFASDFHLAFVCGAAGASLPGGEVSCRSSFLSFVEADAAIKLKCIRAEEAAIDLLRQVEERAANLSLFEKFIADTVDSVVIFPESPGSFAELGYFSAFEAISKKTAIGVLAVYQDSSFVSLGPIHHIAAVSKYRPTPIVVNPSTQEGFGQLVERLAGASGAHRPYRNLISPDPQP